MTVILAKRAIPGAAPLYLMLVCALALFAANTQGGCLDQQRLTGVNLAGAEFNGKRLPGTVYKDYTYPSSGELDYIASQGANIIRLPFLWERVQPVAYGPFDKAELGRIHTTVNSAAAKGLCVLLDVHNYAKFYEVKITGELEDGSKISDAFIAFWLAMAKEFPDPHKTIFGLMNEPASISLVDWAVIAKQTLTALRQAKATNQVFVAGGRWSGVHDWFAGQAASNATELDDLRDPLNRTTIEVHQYTDKDYSGTHTETTGPGCRPPEDFDNKFERITEWAKANQQKLFLGEFGVPRSSECLATLTRFLELTNNPVWHGWTYWAAGSWWGSYPLALSGANQPMAPQWEPLKAFFFSTSTSQTDSSKQSVPLPPKL